MSENNINHKKIPYTEVIFIMFGIVMSLHFPLALDFIYDETNKEFLYWNIPKLLIISIIIIASWMEFIRFQQSTIYKFDAKLFITDITLIFEFYCLIHLTIHDFGISFYDLMSFGIITIILTYMIRDSILFFLYPNDNKPFSTYVLLSTCISGIFTVMLSASILFFNFSSNAIKFGHNIFRNITTPFSEYPDIYNIIVQNHRNYYINNHEFTIQTIQIMISFFIICIIYFILRHNLWTNKQNKER